MNLFYLFNLINTQYNFYPYLSGHLVYVYVIKINISHMNIFIKRSNATQISVILLKQKIAKYKKH